MIAQPANVDLLFSFPENNQKVMLNDQIEAESRSYLNYSEAPD
jgi:hypothetical protein